MANYFPNHKKGDTFEGKTIKLYVGTGPDKVPMDLTGVTAKMEFRPLGVRTPAFVFQTSDNTLTIPNPIDGTIIMQPRILDANAGDYNYDLQLIFPNGNVKTFLTNVWKIVQDVTRT